MLTLITRQIALAKEMDNHCRGVTELVRRSPSWEDRPRRVDFVITRARLSVGLERWAGSLGAMIIHYPESVQYLIDNAVKRDVVAMGSEYQKVF